MTKEISMEYVYILGGALNYEDSDPLAAYQSHDDAIAMREKCEAWVKEVKLAKQNVTAISNPEPPLADCAYYDRFWVHEVRFFKEGEATTNDKP